LGVFGLLATHALTVSSLSFDSFTKSSGLKDQLKEAQALTSALLSSDNFSKISSGVFQLLATALLISSL
jgi:hypothetical protein